MLWAALGAVVAASLIAGVLTAWLVAGSDAAVVGALMLGAVEAPLPPQANTRSANELSSTNDRFAIVPPHGKRASVLSAQ
jgi:hypothetical protein